LLPAYYGKLQECGEASTLEAILGNCSGPLFSRFDERVAELDRLRPPAAAWLRAIDPRKWARAHFPRRRFGHDTSNIVESVNKVLKQDRELPVTALLNAIGHRVIDSAAARLAAATKAINEAQG
jgi:hypothetical protein